MATEIEHKYLVKDDSYKRLATSRFHIVQGYLNRDPDRTVRIRLRDDKGFLTVKGRNHGDTRQEFEYEIPFADAMAMISLCEGGVIDKTRWIVPYGGMTWEVDEFHGLLADITVAEIELHESTRDYPVPDFIGKEVTGDPSYYNSHLTLRAET
ncbi:MAG: CYTH domain-containing protein [Muribaculaceae bacterium]|nr:CYTH domain-containing protein [Muribaculaceae bacterium]